MKHTVQLKLEANEANNPILLEGKIKENLPPEIQQYNGYKIIKKSVDARSKIIWINITVEIFGNEDVPNNGTNFYNFSPIKKDANKIIIIGAGPAGIFAALQCIELGIQPIILERGKDVRSRRRDLAKLNKEGIINGESNYCFGEGGAGTYSDGKLYTRSNKRGNIKRILELFVQFGADEKILYENHPHIGTNKLPHIITAMRNCIEQCGGLFLFGKKMVDFEVKNELITKVFTADGDSYEAEAVLLATGHSARDIFELLYRKNILIEAKPFALGVRVEHPQQLIDSIQYKCATRNEYLEPASYSLVHQVNGKGVFSFCMCPGGIIATASTAPNELVVNGWSPSKRNNAFANSGMVVEVNTADLIEMQKYHPIFDDKEKMNSPLSMLYFQKAVEAKAYAIGGGKFVAPAQRLVDFTNKKNSTDLPSCSYLPGINSSNLYDVLPPLISSRLAVALKEFGKKLHTNLYNKSYYTNEAILVATESRTSSPVKIPRDAEKLHHPQIKNLFPCGEGAGYAGGIVSAAMDGERCVKAIQSLPALQRRVF